MNDAFKLKAVYGGWEVIRVTTTSDDLGDVTNEYHMGTHPTFEMAVQSASMYAGRALSVTLS
jgi:hypothetical protein